MSRKPRKSQSRYSRQRYSMIRMFRTDTLDLKRILDRLGVSRVAWLHAVIQVNMEALGIEPAHLPGADTPTE